MLSETNANEPLWLHRAYGNSTSEQVSEMSRRNLKAKSELVGINEYLKINGDVIPEEVKAEKLAQIENLQQVVEATEPYLITIGSLVRESEKKAKAFLMVEFVKLNLRLHLKNPMTSADIELIADTIIRDYRPMKIADLAVFLDLLCSGAFGQLFERIDSTKVIPALASYYDGQIERAKERTYGEHSIERDITIQMREYRDYMATKKDNEAKGMAEITKALIQHNKENQ